MVKDYVPEKGDFVMIDFNPQAGKEQSGHRPGLVLSPGKYYRLTGLCIICPITDSVKGYSFEVACDSDKVSGVILSDHVKNLDWKVRRASFKGKASKEVMAHVLGKLNSIINY